MPFGFGFKDRGPTEDNAPIRNSERQQTRIPSSCAELETLSDEDLVAQLVSGGHDALTVLFGRYCGIVFSVARRALKDNGEAEEAMQQVFLDIYKAANQFDRQKGSFK